MAQVRVGARGARADRPAAQRQAVGHHRHALRRVVRLHHRVVERQRRRARAAGVRRLLRAPLGGVHVDGHVRRAARGVDVHRLAEGQRHADRLAERVGVAVGRARRDRHARHRRRRRQRRRAPGRARRPGPRPVAERARLHPVGGVRRQFPERRPRRRAEVAGLRPVRFVRRVRVAREPAQLVAGHVQRAAVRRGGPAHRQRRRRGRARGHPRRRPGGLLDVGHGDRHRDLVVHRRGVLRRAVGVLAVGHRGGEGVARLGLEVERGAAAHRDRAVRADREGRRVVAREGVGRRVAVGVGGRHRPDHRAVGVVLGDGEARVVAVVERRNARRRRGPPPVHLVGGVVAEPVVGQVRVGARGARADRSAAERQAVAEHRDARLGQVRLHHLVGERQRIRPRAAGVRRLLLAPLGRVHVDRQFRRAARRVDVHRLAEGQRHAHGLAERVGVAAGRTRRDGHRRHRRRRRGLRRAARRAVRPGACPVAERARLHPVGRVGRQFPEGRARPGAEVAGLGPARIVRRVRVAREPAQLVARDRIERAAVRRRRPARGQLRRRGRLERQVRRRARRLLDVGHGDRHRDLVVDDRGVLRRAVGVLAVRHRGGEGVARPGLEVEGRAVDHGDRAVVADREVRGVLAREGVGQRVAVGVGGRHRAHRGAVLVVLVDRQRRLVAVVERRRARRLGRELPVHLVRRVVVEPVVREVGVLPRRRADRAAVERQAVRHHRDALGRVRFGSTTSCANTSSEVPEPLAYAACFSPHSAGSMSIVSCGVPPVASTSTAPSNVTVTRIVSPSA